MIYMLDTNVCLCGYYKCVLLCVNIWPFVWIVVCSGWYTSAFTEVGWRLVIFADICKSVWISIDTCLYLLLSVDIWWDVLIFKDSSCHLLRCVDIPCYLLTCWYLLKFYLMIVVDISCNSRIFVDNYWYSVFEWQITTKNI